MSENDFRLECFSKAEAELLAVVQWMENCKKTQVLESKNHNGFDKMTLIGIAFQVNANTCKLGLMYASLSSLTKAYNRQFASFLGKDRLNKVLGYFEEMKNTMFTSQSENECQDKDKKENEMENENKSLDSHQSHLFSMIEHTNNFSDTEVAHELTLSISQFRKALLANLMVCKRITQEEQDNLDSLDALEMIYQQSLQETWENVKDFSCAFHEEDFKEEMAVTKEIADGDSSILQRYYHQWTPQQFTRHAIAVHLLRIQQQRLASANDARSLFPDDPAKEKNAIKVARELEHIILKTRKVNHSDNRQFATRCIVFLKEELEYEGTMSSFLAFLTVHYQGKLCFPDLSAFSVDNKKMFQLERQKNTADGMLKLKALNRMAFEQAARVRQLLAVPNSIRISA